VLVYIRSFCFFVVLASLILNPYDAQGQDRPLAASTIASVVKNCVNTVHQFPTDSINALFFAGFDAFYNPATQRVENNATRVGDQDPLFQFNKCMAATGFALGERKEGGPPEETSKTVRYLMSEPVSLFEWGMYRLESAAKALNWGGIDSVNKHLATVDYEWSKNQLKIELVVYPRSSSLQKNTAKQICASIVKQTKSEFGVEPGFEALRAWFGIGTFFSHKYFDKSDTPKSLGGDLEAITNLKVKVMTSKSDQAPFKEASSCSSDFLSREIKYFTTTQSEQ
jgi:hypothetical protein